VIIYNVTINVNDSIHLEWLQWMKKEHIPDMLKTGLFTGFRMSRLLEVDDDGVTYSIQYYVRNMNEYNIYKKEYAAKFQQDALNKFKEGFSAFRTIMEVVE
jgi:hypothetical protein